MATGEPGYPRARKSLGQNFLATAHVAERIAAALRPERGALVFEIGPGRGALTRPLAAAGARIVAFEIDPALVERLRAEFAGAANVEIIRADIRKVDLDAEAALRGAAAYKLAGNIPYHLTSSILIDLARRRSLAAAVLMVQREVADRILAAPGERACGILSIFLQSYFIIEKVLTVRPGSFTPPPKVMSVVIGLAPLNPPPGPPEREEFLAFLKTCFGHRRKKLRNVVDGAFPGAPAIQTLAARTGIDFDERPEALSLDQWFRLYEATRLAAGGRGE